MYRNSALDQTLAPRESGTMGHIEMPLGSLDYLWDQVQWRYPH